MARALGSALVLLAGMVALYGALDHRETSLARRAGEQIDSSVRAEQRSEPRTAPPAAPEPSAAATSSPVPSVQPAQGASTPVSGGLEVEGALAQQEASPPPTQASASKPAGVAPTRVHRQATPSKRARDAVQTARAPTARPQPPAPTEPAAVTPVRGQVFVSTTAPARVFFRGKFVGTAPLGLSLPVGEQTLELRPELGGPPVSVAVNVKQGGVAMTRVTVPRADAQ